MRLCGSVMSMNLIQLAARSKYSKICFAYVYLRIYICISIQISSGNSRGGRGKHRMICSTQMYVCAYLPVLSLLASRAASISQSNIFICVPTRCTHAHAAAYNCAFFYWQIYPKWENLLILARRVAGSIRACIIQAPVPRFFCK